jgi:hypothetical protein
MDLTPELMVMKISILEEQFKKMERLVQSRINILNDCATPIPQVNDGGG